MGSNVSPCMCRGRPRLRFNFNGRDDDRRVTMGTVPAGREGIFAHNFEVADTDMLFAQFKMAEAGVPEYLAAGWETKGNVRAHLLACRPMTNASRRARVNLLDAAG